MKRLKEAWDQFWFTETSHRTLALVMRATGAVVALWAVALVPDAPSFFRVADAPLATPGVPTWFLAHLVTGPGVAATIALGTSTAGVLLMLGRAVRVSALVAFVGVSLLISANPFIFNTGDRILRSILFVVLVSPLRLTVKGPGLDAARSMVPVYPLRLLQLILTFGYLASVANKLQGRTWPGGTAIAGLAQHADMARFIDIPSAVTDRAWLVATLTIGTLVIQGLLPVLLWVPRFRPVGFLVGGGFHLAIDLVLVVGFFAPVMALLYLSFLTDSDLDRIRRLLRRPSFGTGEFTPSPVRVRDSVATSLSPDDAARIA